MTRAKDLSDYARLAPVITNLSTATSQNNLVLFVMAGGSDTISGISHGQTVGTAFATWQAALRWAKHRVTFIGPLSVVELRFGPGSWGFFSLGSNLEQAMDWYPFAIFIRAQDPDNPNNWPRFNAITNGGFAGAQLIYAQNVEIGYCTALRQNTTVIHDVRFWDYGYARGADLPYAFLANVGGTIYAFGTCEVLGGGPDGTDPITYTVAFFYAASDSRISLENGDVPEIFPEFVLTGQGNITSPFKYRAVLNSFVWADSNVYPDLTYAGKFWRDSSSVSSQTGADNAFKRVPANTGLVGHNYNATGELEQWGNTTLTSIAVGRTNAAATVTLPIEYTGSYHIQVETNNVVLDVARASGATSTQFSVDAFNKSASAAGGTMYWRTIGYPA
jgi:hypothetical protein